MSLGVAFGGLLMVASAATAQASPSPVLASEITEWLSARIEQARASTPEEAATTVRETLDELRDRLVETGFDEPLARALTSTTISGPEGEPAPQPARALRHVGARLQRFGEACSGSAPAARPAARAALEEILDDPVFVSTPPEATPLQRLTSRVRKWLGGVFGAMARVAAANTVVVLVVLGILLVAAVAFILSQVVRWSRPRKSRDAARRLRVETSRSSSLPDLLALARREAAAGRGLEALRLLVHGVVVSLRFRGLLPDEPGLTDLEGVRVLGESSADELHRDFRDLVELHDRGVYGGRGAPAGAVERAIELAQQIVPAPIEAER
jgi:hypothetical protein